MDVSLLLNTTDESPITYRRSAGNGMESDEGIIAGSPPSSGRTHRDFPPGVYTTNSFADAQVQSGPFVPLRPKPPGSSATGVQPATGLTLQMRTKGYQREPPCNPNQILWPVRPGGWPGPCQLHSPQGVARLKGATPFTPEEDAALIHMLERICGSRNEVPNAVLGRTTGNINIRRDQLYEYKYCTDCAPCHVFMETLFRLKEKYKGACWTIRHVFPVGQIDILIPPPCRVYRGEPFPLPIVAKVRGKRRELAVSVTAGHSTTRLVGRVVNFSTGYCYMFRSQELWQPGTLNLRLYTPDTGEFSLDFVIACIEKTPGSHAAG